MSFNSVASVTIPLNLCTLDPRIPGAECVVLKPTALKNVAVIGYVGRFNFPQGDSFEAASARFKEQVSRAFTHLPVDIDAKQCHADFSDTMGRDLEFRPEGTLLGDVKDQVIEIAKKCFGEDHVRLGSRDIIQTESPSYEFSQQLFSGGQEYRPMIRIHAPVLS